MAKGDASLHELMIRSTSEEYKNNSNNLINKLFVLSLIFFNIKSKFLESSKNIFIWFSFHFYIASSELS